MDILTLISWSLVHGQDDATVRFRCYIVNISVKLSYLSSEARLFSFTVLIEYVIGIYSNKDQQITTINININDQSYLGGCG